MKYPCPGCLREFTDPKIRDLHFNSPGCLRSQAIRIESLTKHSGEPRPNLIMKDDWENAVRENRVVTVHHTQTAGRLTLWGEVGHHPVDVFELLVFPRPLPRVAKTRVNGMNHFKI